MSHFTDVKKEEQKTLSTYQYIIFIRLVLKWNMKRKMRMSTISWNFLSIHLKNKKIKNLAHAAVSRKVVQKKKIKS